MAVLFMSPRSIKIRKPNARANTLSPCNKTTTASWKQNASITPIKRKISHGQGNEGFETRRKSGGQCSHMDRRPAEKEEVSMQANAETMFSARVKPWHGIGAVVAECPNSQEAVRLAGLDRKAEQKNVYADGLNPIPGYKANVRDRDQSVLGVISDRYQVLSS